MKVYIFNISKSNSEVAQPLGVAKKPWHETGVSHRFSAKFRAEVKEKCIRVPQILLRNTWERSTTSSCTITLHTVSFAQKQRPVKVRPALSMTLKEQEQPLAESLIP